MVRLIVVIRLLRTDSDIDVIKSYLTILLLVLMVVGKAINYPKLDVNLIEWLASQLSGNNEVFTHINYYVRKFYQGSKNIALKVMKKSSIHPVPIIDDIAKIAKNDPKCGFRSKLTYSLCKGLGKSVDDNDNEFCEELM
ncbi:2155_t:CDS:2, partial [Dentiscutata heterogama]